MATKLKRRPMVTTAGGGLPLSSPLTEQLYLLDQVYQRVNGDSFETLVERIAFQKRFYLLGALGLDFGYDFAWNTYGPYSHDLARDMERMEDVRSELRAWYPGLSFSDEIGLLLDRFSELAEPPGATDGVLWLEVLSSVHFLIDNGVLSEDSNEEKVAEVLIGLKPRFEMSRELVGEALGRLRAA